MNRAARGSTPFVALDRGLCDACWECIAACPESVLDKLDFGFHRHAKIRNGERCAGCRKCIKVCPTGALSDRRPPVVASRHHDPTPMTELDSPQPPCSYGTTRDGPSSSQDDWLDATERDPSPLENDFD